MCGPFNSSQQTFEQSLYHDTAPSDSTVLRVSLLNDIPSSADKVHHFGSLNTLVYSVVSACYAAKPFHNI